jgi:hypothetical protein
MRTLYIVHFLKIRLINSPAYCRTENSPSDNPTADHCRLQYTGTYVRNIIRNILKNKVWSLKCIKLT